MSMAPRRILSIWLAAFAIDRWRLAEGCARGEGADAQTHLMGAFGQLAPCLSFTQTRGHDHVIAFGCNLIELAQQLLGHSLVVLKKRNACDASLFHVNGTFSNVFGLPPAIYADRPAETRD